MTIYADHKLLSRNPGLNYILRNFGPKSRVISFWAIAPAYPAPTQNFKKIKIMKNAGNNGSYQDQRKKSGVPKIAISRPPPPWSGGHANNQNRLSPDALEKAPKKRPKKRQEMDPIKSVPKWNLSTTMSVQVRPNSE